jgi:hypothetical protein
MNFSKESVLDLVIVGFSRDTSHVPERQSIEEAVDNFLLPFPHLRPDREWILAQALGVLVTGVGKAVELVNPDDYDEWLEGCDRSSWRTWPWLQLYLKERLRRPSAVLDELNRSTDRVLDLIGNPRREGLWDHRGMVVGHVQSGKTQHYTALAAKAIVGAGVPSRGSRPFCFRRRYRAGNSPPNPPRPPSPQLELSCQWLRFAPAAAVLYHGSAS